MLQLLADTAPYLMTGAACLLIGSGLGYYTANMDNKEKNSRDRH